MPNDKNGKNVTDGAIVTVKFRVVASSKTTGDATTNLTLEAVDSGRYGGPRPRISVNSKQVELDSEGSKVDPLSVEPVGGSTPKPVPPPEGGVNETPRSGDPVPGGLGKGGVASPPRGDNAGFREPSASIGDGVLTGNPGVPESTVPAGQRDVEAHGGSGDPVGRGEKEPIRQNTDGTQVNVRDLSTPVNVRDDAPSGDKTAATESFEAVKARQTQGIPREHINTGDAVKDAAAKARGERPIGSVPDIKGDVKDHKNPEGNQPAPGAVGNQPSGGGKPSSQSVATAENGRPEVANGNAEDEKPKKMNAAQRRKEADRLHEENTAEELREMALDLDIPVSGTKAELAERIVEARNQ